MQELTKCNIEQNISKMLNDNDNFEYSYISNNTEDTIYLAQNFAKYLKCSDIIVLNGELGCGKTVFVSGIAKYFDIEEQISSPTFTIVNEYEGKMPLYHFDVYRIGSSDEMYDIGYEDYINGEGVCIIEWANLIEDILPDEYLYIELRYKDMSREMILNPIGKKYEKIVEELTK